MRKVNRKISSFKRGLVRNNWRKTSLCCRRLKLAKFSLYACDAVSYTVASIEFGLYA